MHEYACKVQGAPVWIWLFTVCPWICFPSSQILVCTRHLRTLCTCTHGHTQQKKVIAEIVQLEYPLRHTISWSTKHLWAWITITIEGVLVLKLILYVACPLNHIVKGEWDWKWKLITWQLDDVILYGRHALWVQARYTCTPFINQEVISAKVHMWSVQCSSMQHCLLCTN